MPPYGISITVLCTLLSNMDDVRLVKVPGDVIGHDNHLDKWWE